MKQTPSIFRTPATVLTCCIACAQYVISSPLAVTNFSFEDTTGVGLPFDACGLGCAYNTGPVPGWLTAIGGQFQPGVQAGNLTYFNTVPDGITVGYANAGGSLSQTVNAVVQYGTIYTLTVDQGVRKDLPDPGQIALRIGQNIFAVGTGMPATPGNWSNYTAQYVGTAADVGKSITIVLSTPGDQGDWDNVRLDATGGTPCVSECLNNFLPKPGIGTANQLIVVLKGDVRNQINLAATNSALTNPFAYVDENIFGGANTSSVSLSLDANGNTDLTFTAGLHPILNSYSFNYGGQTNGLPHYGYAGLSNAAIDVLSQTWSNQGTPMALPTLSALCPALSGPVIGYGVLFAEVTQNGLTEGQWMECPLDKSNTALMLTNPTSGSEMLSDLGFLFSPTDIPLELLNFAGLPPPDAFNTTFFALTQYNGLTLSAGDSVIVNAALPEPSSMLLLAAGLLSSLVVRRKSLS